MTKAMLYARRVRRRRKAISTIYRVTDFPGVKNLVARRYGGMGCVLMWHSVVANVDEWLRQDIRNSSRHLDETIRWAILNEIDIVDMNTALSRLREGNPRNFIVLTFDDGYKDNLALALPICERYGVPMTVYVTTGLITGQAEFWWGPMVSLLKQNDAIKIPGSDFSFTAETLDQKITALGAIAAWVHEDVAQRVPLILETLARHGLSSQESAEEQILSIDDLRTLGGHPLVTIGSHTVSHRLLRPLSADDARNEVIASKLWLEELLDAPIEHFSYPHGNPQACMEREADMVRDAGYRSAVSTRRGNLFPAHADAPFMLPRGAVNPSRESASTISAQVSGVPRLLDSRLGHPIDVSTVAGGH